MTNWQLLHKDGQTNVNLVMTQVEMLVGSRWDKMFTSVEAQEMAQFLGGKELCLGTMRSRFITTGTQTVTGKDLKISNIKENHESIKKI